jgi:hypothetical protein
VVTFWAYLRFHLLQWGGYDEHQALEGAAGSAGRTESTSVST